MAWIVRLGSTSRHGGPSDFATAFGGLAIERLEGGTLRVADPEYGAVLFHADGRVEAGGQIDDPAAWTVQGDATIAA
jgi:hypothetical protein